MSPTVLGAIKLTNAMKTSAAPHTVYMIVVNEEFVKIGFTAFKSAVGRVNDIQKGCPYPFRLALELPGGKPLEQALHAIFAEYRHRDEWFRLTGDLKEYLENFK